MRVLVCGGRTFYDREAIFHELHELAFKHGKLVIIHGAQRGADTLAKEFAVNLSGAGHTHLPFRAEWSVYGNAAGPIRNQRMLDEGRPDLVVAFPGGKGTANMVKLARAAGVEVREISK